MTNLALRPGASSTAWCADETCRKGEEQPLVNRRISFLSGAASAMSIAIHD
jgi:hypothetical protein